MGVVRADGDEGSSGGGGEVGGKVVRVLLGGSDGSGGSIKVDAAGGVEGLHVEGGVIREGGGLREESSWCLESEESLRRRGF